jgi:hypothetical protein
MEHLYIPTDAEYISILYKSTEPYSNLGNFLNYPAHYGRIPKHLLGAENFGERNPVEVE